MLRAFAVTVGSAILLPAFLSAQDAGRRSVLGTVRDSAGSVVPYVNVFSGSTRLVSSDSGTFAIRNVGRQALKLTFFRIGFEPAELHVPPGPDTTIRVVMTRVPVQLSAVQVLGTQMSDKLALRGYYDRMRDVERGINRGYFVTPEDLERRKPNFITQMFEGYPSIRVKTTIHGLNYAEILGTGGCKMTVYLDGVRIIGKLNPRAEEPVNLVVKPSEIAGAEIYPRGVGAPPQYQELNGSCGIVLIWTR